MKAKQQEPKQLAYIYIKCTQLQHLTHDISLATIIISGWIKRPYKFEEAQANRYNCWMHKSAIDNRKAHALEFKSNFMRSAKNRKGCFQIDNCIQKNISTVVATATREKSVIPRITECFFSISSLIIFLSGA